MLFVSSFFVIYKRISSNEKEEIVANDGQDMRMEEWPDIAAEVLSIDISSITIESIQCA
jgi:hypothetical protein